MPAQHPETAGPKVSDLDRARGRKDRAAIARFAEALGDAAVSSGDPVAAEAYFATAHREGSFPTAGDRARVVVKEARCLSERARYGQALRRLERVMDFFERAPQGTPSASVLGLAADVCLKNGRVRRAYRYAARARALAARRGVGAEALRISLSLGAVFARLGRWEEAGALFEDVLSAARRSGDRERMGQAYNNLGLIHKNRCEWGRAVDCFEQAIRLARAANVECSLAERLNNMGIVYYKTGDWSRAEKTWREALRIARRAKHSRSEAPVRLGLGRLEAARGHADKAEMQYRKALELSQACDDLRTQTLVHEFLTELHLDGDDLEAASRDLETAISLAQRIGALTDLTAEIRCVQARLASRTESPARVLRFISRGLEIARRTGDRYEEARFLALRAEVRAAEGNPRAGHRFEEAIERLSDLGIRHLLAQTLVRFAAWMADLEKGTQPRDRVQESLIVACEIFEKLGDMRGFTGARISLARWKLRQGGVDGALAILRSLEDLNSPHDTLRRQLAEVREEVELRLVEKVRVEVPPASWAAESSARAFAGIPEPAEFLTSLAAGMGADRAVWVRLSRAHSEAHLLARVNIDGAAARHLADWMCSDGCVPRSKGDPILSVSAADDSRFRRAEWRREVRSVLILPVLSSGTVVGAVYLDRGQARGLPFGAKEMETLSAARPMLETLSLLDEPSPGEGIRIHTAAGIRTIPYILGGPRLEKSLSLIGRICDSTVPVLIQGETGTGKELVAKALHGLGDRCSKPFIAQNCAAIPRELLESELFGYMSGAFTGAVNDKMGLFEAASGGTFFLDEVPEIDPATQAKLLRLLETGVVRRLGAVDESRVDVRVVSATNRSLLAEVERGEFREDLFYRLNVVSIELPPLRDRAQDIPVLATEFLRRSFAQEGKLSGRLSDETLQTLTAYAWPGNVRELENEMKRLGALGSAGEVIRPTQLSSRIGLENRKSSTWKLEQKIQSVERKEIVDTLEAERWNLSQAARALGGMPRSTLVSKMKRLGIQRHSTT